MQGLSTHAKGLWITGLGVLVITPETLLIRLVAADPWTLLVWRSTLMALAMTMGLLIIYRGRTLACFRSIGHTGLAVSLVISVASICFILALDHTSVANVLIIMAAAPLFAGLFSALFLGEPPPLITWLAIAGAMLGIGVIVIGSLGGGSLVGDLFALGMAASLGGAFTIIRQARAVSMVPAMVVSGVLTALVCLPLSAPLSIQSDDIVYLLLIGLAILPLATALQTLGPRYLPAPEVSLLVLLETVLGPFWVWLVLAETPSQQTLLGGAIVIAVLLAHSVLSLRRAAVAVP